MTTQTHFTTDFKQNRNTKTYNVFEQKNQTQMLQFISNEITSKQTYNLFQAKTQTYDYNLLHMKLQTQNLQLQIKPHSQKHNNLREIKTKTKLT